MRHAAGGMPVGVGVGVRYVRCAARPTMRPPARPCAVPQNEKQMLVTCYVLLSSSGRCVSYLRPQVRRSESDYDSTVCCSLSGPLTMRPTSTACARHDWRRDSRCGILPPLQPNSCRAQGAQSTARGAHGGSGTSEGRDWPATRVRVLHAHIKSMSAAAVLPSLPQPPTSTPQDSSHTCTPSPSLPLLPTPVCLNSPCHTWAARTQHQYGTPVHQPLLHASLALCMCLNPPCRTWAAHTATRG